MSGDYSRFVFDPTLDYHGVALQQGRPLTDWDWNDATAQINRRQQADSYDTLGQAVVPLTTKDAFAIQLGGGSFTIGPGRMYVDGLLAENHGLPPSVWDSTLAELRGTAWVPYDQQPYLPNPPPLPTGGGLDLVYLDVWQREVTWIEAPDLIEPALGVDTTTRIQTVWQVKLLTNVGAGLTCDTPMDDVPGWDALIAPSAGRLTSATGAPTSDNPCQIPPAGGYKGLENQLYRVEIHDGGTFGTATFKWSRNNASIVANVTKFIDTRTLVVDSIGKDSVLRFSDGDWVEITDDWRELNNLGGEMHRIVIGGGVDDATRTISLETDVTAAWFPSGTLQARHTRLKRWDQQGKVLQADGTVYIDLDGSVNGLIAVPAAGTQISVEAGILINFDLATAGGQFKSGDYWMFAARAATAEIELLNQAPPRGIHHHYAKLGYTTLSGQPQDCRQFWPPASGGESCACTICVTAAAHNAGTATIQEAIAAVITAGGGTVCLEAGTFNVGSTLTIHGAASLRLRGQGPATQLVASIDTAFRIDGCGDLGFSDFSLQLAATGDGAPVAAIGLAIGSVVTLDVTQLAISSAPTDATRTDTAIQLTDHAEIAEFRRCTISTATGIATVRLESERGYFGSILRIDSNTFACATIAVDAPQIVGSNTILVQCCGNAVDGGSDAGFRFGGGADRIGRVEVADNRMQVSGHGIIGTMSGMDIHDNEVHYQQGNAATNPKSIGIAIGDQQHIAKTTVDDLRIFGNRVTDFAAAGIASVVPLGNAMIKSNCLERIGGGILLTAGSTGALSIENNQVSDVTGLGAGSAALVFGILVAGAASTQIRDNTLARVAAAAAGTIYAEGIYVQNCGHVAIDGNTIVDLAPQGSFKGIAVGIMVQNPFGSAALHDNQISRSSEASDADASPWYAIAIAGDAPVVAKPSGIGKAVGKNSAKKAGATMKVIWASSPLHVETAKLSALFKAARLQISMAAPAAAAPAYQRAMVQGNQLSGYGGTPIVQISSGDECDFSGNQCAAETKANLAVAPAEVAIGATALTINGNRIHGTRPAIALYTTVKDAAVVGNITHGAITLNNVPLAASWQAMNISGF